MNYATIVRRKADVKFETVYDVNTTSEFGVPAVTITAGTSEITFDMKTARFVQEELAKLLDVP